MRSKKLSSIFEDVLLTLMGIAVCTIFIIGYIQQGELSENNYANITEVKADNAIKRGWVPSIIPNSSYNILEEHRIDSNKFEGSFNYLEKDEATFLSSLQYVNRRYIWDYFKFEIDKEQNKVIFTSLTEVSKQKILEQKNLFDISLIILFNIAAILATFIGSPILFLKSVLYGIQEGWRKKKIYDSDFYTDTPLTMLLISIIGFCGGAYFLYENFFMFLNIIIDYFN